MVAGPCRLRHRVHAFGSDRRGNNGGTMMKRLFPVAVLLLFALAGLPLSADDKKNDGFVPMFNGKDLAGWVNANCAPGTFYVKDSQIITTGKPTGFLRTAKHYENF